VGLFRRKQRDGPPSEAAKSAPAKTTVRVKTKVVNADDLPGLGDEIMHALQEHGVDMGKSQTIDASTIPGLGDEIARALGEHGIGADDFGGGATVVSEDSATQLAKLAALHKSGDLSDWEFDVAKKKLLDEN
jgi:hypothetical protein